MWGVKDAPRDFGMRLSRSLKEIGYHQGVTDPQIWRKFSQNYGYAADNTCGFHPNHVMTHKLEPQSQSKR
eukprot:1650990-Prorocentrum_lima.AAC.1